MSEEALLALAARCEAMEGPEREIDEAVAIALEGAKRHVELDAEWGAIPMLVSAEGHGPYVMWHTASLDSCRALQARVLLPGHRIEVAQYDCGWDVTLRNAVGRAIAVSIDARTEEGGRLAALLKAKAKELAA